MIMIGVSVCMFILVPAHPCNSGWRDVKRLLSSGPGIVLAVGLMYMCDFSYEIRSDEAKMAMVDTVLGRMMSLTERLMTRRSTSWS